MNKRFENSMNSSFYEFFTYYSPTPPQNQHGIIYNQMNMIQYFPGIIQVPVHNQIPLQQTISNTTHPHQMITYQNQQLVPTSTSSKEPNESTREILENNSTTLQQNTGKPQKKKLQFNSEQQNRKEFLQLFQPREQQRQDVVELKVPDLNSTKIIKNIECPHSEQELIISCIMNLKDPQLKDQSFDILANKRETFLNLAPILWYSKGTITLIIDEIVSFYPQLLSNCLTLQASTHFCSVLGLLQCLALHQETKTLIITAHLPLYIFPFMNTTSKLKPFENIRAASLGIIGALIKGEETKPIDFLIKSELIPICLRIVSQGMELSKIIALFILQKIIINENGLDYVCSSAERFFAVTTVLKEVYEEFERNKFNDLQLIKNIFRCYQSLSQHSKGRESLKQMLPKSIKLSNFNFMFDESIDQIHQQILNNLDLKN